VQHPFDLGNQRQRRGCQSDALPRELADLYEEGSGGTEGCGVRCATRQQAQHVSAAEVDVPKRRLLGQLRLHVRCKEPELQQLLWREAGFGRRRLHEHELHELLHACVTFDAQLHKALAQLLWQQHAQIEHVSAVEVDAAVALGQLDTQVWLVGGWWGEEDGGGEAVALAE
jgi:hypothetical protein